MTARHPGIHKLDHQVVADSGAEYGQLERKGDRGASLKQERASRRGGGQQRGAGLDEVEVEPPPRGRADHNRDQHPAEAGCDEKQGAVNHAYVISTRSCGMTASTTA